MAVQTSIADNTIEVFDTFYDQKLNVPVNQWDAVYSYFVGVLKGNPESVSTKETAKKFATVLFKIAQESGTDVMIFMDYFRANVKDKIKLNAEMAYYLNLLKSKSALYGVGRIPNPNPAVQRNVIP